MNYAEIVAKSVTLSSDRDFQHKQQSCSSTIHLYCTNHLCCARAPHRTKITPPIFIRLCALSPRYNILLRLAVILAHHRARQAAGLARSWHHDAAKLVAAADRLVRERVELRLCEAANDRARRLAVHEGDAHGQTGDLEARSVLLEPVGKLLVLARQGFDDAYRARLVQVGEHGLDELAWSAPRLVPVDDDWLRLGFLDDGLREE